MASQSTMTVTVDRISNGGNAIAKQERDGKTIHVPATSNIGETLEVRLIDKGGFFEATLVDSTQQTQPPQPGLTPDTSDIGKDLVNPERNHGHSFSTGSSPAETASGGALRSWVSSRKL